MIERKLILIGLCGRSGVGKGYVSRIFDEHGVPSVDTDAVYRKLTSASEELSPCMKAIVSRFGDEAALADNSLNRAFLRGIVFSENTRALDDLNKITHGFILEETLRIANELYDRGFSAVMIDAPLLFESGFDKLCDLIICVDAPDELSVRRIMDRDGITREAAERRLSVQLSAHELIRKSDAVVINDGTDRTVDDVANCMKMIAELRQKKLSQLENGK